MCLDKGYDYEEVRAILQAFGFTAPICPYGEEAKVFKTEAGFTVRNLVVERTHSWLNRLRRLVVRWDKQPKHYRTFLQLVCGLIIFRAACFTTCRCWLVARVHSMGWMGLGAALFTVLASSEPYALERAILRTTPALVRFVLTHDTGG